MIILFSFLFVSIFTSNLCFSEDSDTVYLMRVGSDKKLLQEAYETYSLFKEMASPYAQRMAERAAIPFDGFAARSIGEMDIEQLPFVGIWLIKKSNNPIGIIEISPIDLSDGYIEIGIFLIRNRSRPGDAEKSINICFNEYVRPYVGSVLKLVSHSSSGFTRIEKPFKGVIAKIDVSNLASLIVFTRAGFSFVSYSKPKEINTKRQIHLYNPICVLSEDQPAVYNEMQRGLDLLISKKSREEGIRIIEKSWSNLDYR